VSVVDWRAQALNYESLIDAAALDKYVFVRNAYLQRRAYQLDENLHLGVHDRESQFGTLNKFDSPSGPGAMANIDETQNIGEPANTENTILAPDTSAVGPTSSAASAGDASQAVSAEKVSS
jgi:phospholipid-binding lipoprotein MlaA